jgi:hypothetical protein
MGKLKKGLLATVGLVVGVVTLRKFRNRGSDSSEEEETE